MNSSTNYPADEAPGLIASRWSLTLTILLSALVPLLGTLYLRSAYPAWKGLSLPIHSALEVAGSVVGLILAAVILFSLHNRSSSRRVYIACALIAMAVFDIVHGCVAPGECFVWLHSLATLAGGIFFAAACLPERAISIGNGLAKAAGVFLISLALAILSCLYPQVIPTMISEGQFSPVASVINLTGGGLTLLGGIAFAVLFSRTKEIEHLVFVFLCFLFGTSAVLFHFSEIWRSGWWFWHIIRFGAYILPFWIIVFASRRSEEQLIKDQTGMARAIAAGDLHIDIPARFKGDDLGAALQDMTHALRENREAFEQQDWLKTGLTRLDDALRGDPDAATLASTALREICSYLGAQIGAFYVVDRNDESLLVLLGSYAFSKRKNLSSCFRIGEGLVGQAGLEKKQILLKNIPEDYIKIGSQLGECTPRFICVAPCLHQDQLRGVIEIGSLGEWSDLQLDYLSATVKTLGAAIDSARARTHLAQSLSDAQALTEELQAQQEELESANAELESQTLALQNSEEELRTQQEELQVTNEELEEKTEYLSQQRQALQRSETELRSKAAELARSSQYKSEFLANMSHELRTPLNSILILSGSLAENADGNLREDQIESAKVIQGSGNDLLSLINEILDISKIEAGQMELHDDTISIEALAANIRRNFSHVCEDKKITLDVVIEKDAPASLLSDRKRMEQILKNLLSNAIKFTEKGGVTVTFKADLLREKPALLISVQDTGIGIGKDKQSLIFEAFQQAEGGTARKYGGTGLGLSISRKLATLLGGNLELESELGKGSDFRITLPVEKEDISAEPEETGPAIHPETETAPQVSLPPFGSIPDDRNESNKSGSTILVVEDDPVFAKQLQKICRENNFQCLVALSGEEGLALAQEQKPNAVILDIHLPGIDGWSVLAQLKDNLKTRHIPVHIMSADDPSPTALKNGAIGFLSKPARKEDLQKAFDRIEQLLQKGMKDLLVIEDDPKLRASLLKLIGQDDVIGDTAANGREALLKLREKNYDCVILDLSLPDISGFDLLKKAEQDEDIHLPPVIIYTGRELTRKEEATLAYYSESIIVKGVRSEERLFDEVSLFLHRMVEKLPDSKRKMITNLHDSDHMFINKSVLIVDDDMRNLFALSNALTSRGMKTFKAQNGQEALDALSSHPKVDLILMDIMMPTMDGYECMKQIRKNSAFKKLPIIALTAKAMKEDRGKCIAAGASDYMSKPVDMNQLYSMMRVWLYR